MQAKLIGNLGSVHCVLCTASVFAIQELIRKCTHWQILLVGEDQQKGVTELVLVQHALKLLTGLDDTVAIVGINDEDDTLGVLEVMSPQWADLVLSSNIPDGKLDILVFDSLDVES